MLLLGIHIKHCLDVRYDLETKRNRLQKLKLHVDKLTSGGWVPRWRNERESHLTSTSRHRPIFPELKATGRSTESTVDRGSVRLWFYHDLPSYRWSLIIKGNWLASSSQPSQPSQPNHSSCNSAQWLCGPSDLAHTLASWDDWMSMDVQCRACWHSPLGHLGHWWTLDIIGPQATSH